MDIHNISIVNIENVNWWRTRLDHNDPSNFMISPHTRDIYIMKNIGGNRLTSVLVIKGVTSSHMGPYWLGFSDSKNNLSNKAFLNVISNGMYICMYAYNYTCT